VNGFNPQPLTKWKRLSLAIWGLGSIWAFLLLTKERDLVACESTCFFESFLKHSDVLLEPLVTEQETLLFRRHQSLNPSSVEEFPSEYHVWPKPIPSRAGPSLKRKQAIPKLSVPTLETNIETKATCRPPKKDTEVENKTKSSRTKTRSGGGKKAEPRRLQNMASQKKYRDKRANTANLVSSSIHLTVHAHQQMSRYIIKIRRALNDKSTVSSMRCLVNVYQIVDEYRESIRGKYDNHLRHLRLIA
jgi:hypothetical protein